jgi:hypothetical protein
MDLSLNFGLDQKWRMSIKEHLDRINNILFGPLVVSFAISAKLRDGFSESNY